MRISTLWKSGLWSLFLLSFAVGIANAQERTVTGTVTSAEEGALPGVNIILQGTGQGTVSDIEGKYSIQVSGTEAVLVFSSIGYTTEAVTVGNQSVIDLVLAPDVTSLKEIVVTGYASQQKKDLTGSVGVVKTEELNAMPQGNVVNQMQGRVAGVTVTQDSRPGETARIRIRGYGSFQNNDPLYIVDGVPTTDISTINPADVESLSVLKDAGAASIYGARASNGVVVVTTKKGKKGMSVGYNMYVGTQNPGKGPQNLLSTQEYGDLTFLVLRNEGTTTNHPIYGPFDPTNPNQAPPTFPSWAANTQWWDEITNNALIMNHDVTLSGGNDNSKFYSGIGYFKQDGVTLNNFYQRFSGRFNSEFNIKDRVTIGENLTLTYSNRNNVSNQDEGTPLQNVYRLQNIIPVVMTQDVNGNTHDFKVGDWGGSGIAAGIGNSSNYVAERTRDGDDLGQNLRILGNIFADVKIVDGLNFKTSFGGSWGQWYWTDWAGSTYENAENRATASYQEGSGYATDWNWTNTLTYNKQFGDHTILAVLGYEAVKTGVGRDLNAQRADYFSESLSYRTVSNGANITGASSSYYTPRSLVSTFLRADYNFKEKYYLSGTVRRDGSSVFGSEYRYGTFPSVSAAWRITEESFLAGGNFLTDLKIRGGWGQMGNQNPVSPDNQFYLYGGDAGSSNYDLNGTTGSSLQGFRPTRIGNLDTKWETVVSSNIGFDASLFDNAFEVVFDWYVRNSTDLLFNPELPATAGGASVPFVNIAEMKNTGIDLQLIYHKMWSDFNFQANAQLTTVNNEIVSLAEGYDYFDAGGSRIGSFSRNEVGGSMAQFYGYNVIGLFQEGDFTEVGDEFIPVSGVAKQDGGEPGFLRYEDVDGDGEITPEDRQFIGSPIADFTYGLNLDFGWKNFDVSAFFYGSQGNEIFNYNKWWYDFWPSFQGQKSTDLLYNSWTPSNTDTNIPKASNKSNFSTNTQSTSYYVEDASYFRLKQLQIGYTFPKSILGNVFTNARIYVQGINLFTATKYSGMDPEMAASGESGGDVNFGVDRGNVPAVKQFLLGINLGF